MYEIDRERYEMDRERYENDREKYENELNLKGKGNLIGTHKENKRKLKGRWYEVEWNNETKMIRS